MVARLTHEIRRKQEEFPLLQSLVLSGGSVHTDSLVTAMGELTWALSRFCPNLENLQLPVTSNLVLKNVSKMRVKAFKSDRTKSLNKNGCTICVSQSQSAGPTCTS